MSLRDLLEKGNVIFDGAMGTYISVLDRTCVESYEMANITHPELVHRIHSDYMDAGSMVITANTFAANRLNFPADAEKIIQAGMDIALSAAAGKAEVMMSIGQINAGEKVRTEEYIFMADAGIKAGAVNFIFETQNSMSGIEIAAEHIKAVCPNAYIMVSFSVNDSGFTSEGIFAGDVIAQAQAASDIDAVGLNCGCSAVHMSRVVGSLNISGKPFIVMPNAGYPIIVNRRTVYEGDPELFADYICRMVDLKVSGVGGCCGTEPVHIKEIRKMLSRKSSKSGGNVQTDAGINPGNGEPVYDPGSRFWDKLTSGKKPIAVELDPPADCNTVKFLNGVRDLKSAGVDIITIADCPIGRARMDSSLLACKIHREYGVEALPHMTCRDRNLNATQALMLGLYSEGIRNMLLVTGDPVPSAQRDEVKTVYQFNSRKFAAFASALKKQMFPGDVHYFGALNVNAGNFDVQIRLAKEKIENGIVGFLTQPVLTQEAFDNLKRAKDELNGYILGGIIPVVSERNARFMNSEISGINVDEKVCEMYAGLGREEAEDLAVEISSEIARQIAPYVDGYYYMTPFQRTGLIRRIIDAV